MKLSKKGLMRLLDVAFDGDEFYQSNALEVEFEPDDFDGGCFQNGKDHIILTVEEAKALLFMSGIFSIEHYTPDQNKELLNNLYRQLLRQDFESTKKYFECFRKNKQFRNEWKRIEQAEKCNDSN